MKVRDYMNSDIMNFLNIEAKNIITQIMSNGNSKKIHLEKSPKTEYRPSGWRSAKHILSQRKWRCTNSQCSFYFNDQFNFISKHRQSSNINLYQILSKMKNIHVTAANVARRYSISDTAVHYMYLQYLDIRPLPLPEIISVDKVFL